MTKKLTGVLTYSEYKGSRIEWAEDECAQPPRNLPTQIQGSRPVMVSKRNFSSGSVSSNNATNRFQVLDMTDDDDDDDDDDSEDDSDDEEYY